MPERRVELVAHRGASMERVENTMPAFALALERGADALELDVHLTADDRVIVHHDARVGGRDIAASRWDDVRTIPLADGSTLPLLDDVLDMVGNRATVYVELKGANVEASALAVVAAHGQRVAVHSFDHECVVRAARIAPGVPRGVLIDRGTRDPAAMLRAAVQRTGARDVWPHWSLVDASLMAAARARGVRVIVWTVNAVGDAARLAALGVDGICTDDVRLMATL
jgi:glycerophosphoryl diester phosphodiesterase